MDPRCGTPPRPRFPLFRAPYCKRCGTSCNKETGRSRHRYVCKTCDHFCTFDDDKGISYKNPLCQCGFYYRQVEKKAGGSFMTCAIGVCRSLEAYLPKNRSPAGHISSINGPSPVSASTAQVSSSPTMCPLSKSFDSHPALLITNNNNNIDGEFVRLLDHVLSVAAGATLSERIAGSIPDLERGFSALSVAGSGNPAPGQFKMRSATEFERHSKVGAAGELFVLELLLRAIQDTGEVYWESNMRNLVKQHHSDFFEWSEWRRDRND
ncbi:hypothetical protein QBC43DRAFT_332092 [Cladorrhinum sp. PSN259]|nr:hypothetical protein QBC43DRAFT_332092 [Cladorrhinum sp. PSN259]